VLTGKSKEQVHSCRMFAKLTIWLGDRVGLGSIAVEFFGFCGFSYCSSSIRRGIFAVQETVVFFDCLDKGCSDRSELSEVKLICARKQKAVELKQLKRYRRIKLFCLAANRDPSCSPKKRSGFRFLVFFFFLFFYIFFIFVLPFLFLWIEQSGDLMSNQPFEGRHRRRERCGCTQTREGLAAGGDFGGG
jgi:hypothetical protein